MAQDNPFGTQQISAHLQVPLCRREPKLVLHHGGVRTIGRRPSGHPALRPVLGLTLLLPAELGTRPQRPQEDPQGDPA